MVKVLFSRSHHRHGFHTEVVASHCWRTDCSESLLFGHLPWNARSASGKLAGMLVRMLLLCANFHASSRTTRVMISSTDTDPFGQAAAKPKKGRFWKLCLFHEKCMPASSLGLMQHFNDARSVLGVKTCPSCDEEGRLLWRTPDTSLLHGRTFCHAQSQAKIEF